MNLIINAVLVHSLKNIEIFQVEVTEQKSQLIKERLKFERIKAINILKKLKEKEDITSIYHPRNKQYQHDLDRLVMSKRIIKKSIEKINEIYK